MLYNELYKLLKERVNYQDDCIAIDEETTVCNETFESHYYDLLPGHETYTCTQHQLVLHESYCFRNAIGEVDEVLDIQDSKLEENRKFRYHIFKPANETRSNELIFMFHGFNEKSWDKYLPWAHRLVKQTGKTVILFPIAFHMNRALNQWTDRRLMHKLSEERRKQFPNLLGSTLSNVAISTRLHSKPQRFIWSGLQTYFDVVQLVEQIKADKHKHVAPNASIDFFAYSIGGLLAEILMMTNPKGYFDQSKMCLFCGGAVFNRLSPVSKFILDSEANVALYSYVVEHIESHLKHDVLLGHFFSELHPEGIRFFSMLNYKSMRVLRENAFKQMSERIYAITLENDSVVPPYEVINTLQGIARDIPVKIEIMDFSYDYKHEDPFPAAKNQETEVDRMFTEVFNRISRFLA